MKRKQLLLSSALVAFALLAIVSVFIVNTNPAQERNAGDGTIFLVPSPTFPATNEEPAATNESIYPVLPNADNKKGDSDTPANFNSSSDAYRGGTYKSFDDLSPFDMTYADDQAFEFLRDAYAKIDFNSEFKKGNLDGYEFYIEKFYRLVHNEATFMDEESGNEVTLGEYGGLRLDDARECSYYFFDIDDDGAPDLVISNGDYQAYGNGRLYYAFKYLPEIDEFILWRGIEPSRARFHGTRKINNNRDNEEHVFILLDECGNDMFVMTFMRFYLGNEIYIVSAPQYLIDSENELRIPEYIESQGYRFGIHDLILFRLTEEQYNHVTGDYYLANELLPESVREVMYRYEELFENIQS